MANDKGAVVSLTVNAGGEGSGTGVKEVYDLPSSPTGAVAKVECIYITNLTGGNGYVWLDDNETDGTALGAAGTTVKAIQVGANETLEWKPEKDWIVRTGIIAAGSNAGTLSGYRIWAEVDVKVSGV